jgi:hypothetical protein
MLSQNHSPARGRAASAHKCDPYPLTGHHRSAAESRLHCCANLKGSAPVKIDDCLWPEAAFVARTNLVAIGGKAAATDLRLIRRW